MTFHSMLGSFALLAVFSFAGATGPPNVSSTSQPDTILAAQLGPYQVSIYGHEIKTSRPDILAPTPELRRIMITVYRPFLDSFTCPLEHQSLTPYVPPVVAGALLGQLPNGSSQEASSFFDPVKLVNCSRPVLPSSLPGPVILFSPGYAGNHYIYASTLLAAASSGYTVVAIDHTYEAAAVVFPDGFVAYPSAAEIEYDNTLSGQDVLQAIRINDTISILDAIECGEVPGLGRCSQVADSASNCSSSPLRTVMYGHSFGGSTAVNVAALDDRVIAAVYRAKSAWGLK